MLCHSWCPESVNLPVVAALFHLLQGGFSDFQHTVSSTAAAEEEMPVATQQRQILSGVENDFVTHRPLSL